MNITNTYKKSILFAASILTFNAATIPAVAALSNDSVESSSNKTKTSLNFSKTDKDNIHSASIGHKLRKSEKSQEKLNNRAKLIENRQLKDFISL